MVTCLWLCKSDREGTASCDEAWCETQLALSAGLRVKLIFFISYSFLDAPPFTHLPGSMRKPEEHGVGNNRGP